MNVETDTPETYRSGDGLLMVARPDLVRRLESATRRPLTTVIAPAGYGKTTLLRQWQDQCDRDNTYLDADEANRRLVEDGERLPQVVIIDDSHHLSQDALDAVMRLISSASHHVVLAGRHRPGSQLGSLAAAGLVSTIGVDELAFTAAEVAALLDPDRVGTQSADVDELRDFGGWGALLRIHREYARDDAVGEFVSWYGDFFDDQVLGELPEADREFLSTLAFLEDVTAPEAAQVTGLADSARRMARLQNAGLPLRWRHPAMDMHPMLRHHLLARVHLADPEHASRLAGRAARALEQRGQDLAASALAYEWGVPEQAAHIVRRRFFHLLYTRPLALMEHLDRIRLALPDWEATMMLATVVAALGQSAPEVALRTIQRQLPGNPDEITRVRVAAHQLLLARQCCYLDIDLGEVRRLAGEVSAGRLENAEGTPELALFRLEYGVYLMHNGECAPAQEWLVAAMTAARLTNLPAVVTQGFAAQAWLAARDGATETTHRLADLAETMRAQYDLVPECTHLAWLAKATNHLDRGEIDQCRACLAKYRRGSNFPRADTMALAVHLDGFIRYATGDPSAVSVVRGFLADSPKMTGFHEYLVLLALSACLGTVGRVDEMDAVIARLRKIHRPAYGILDLFNGYLLNAESRPEAALELLQEMARGNHGRPKEQLHVLTQLSVAAAQLGHEKLAEGTLVQADELAARLGLNPPGAVHLHTLETPERTFEVSLTDAEAKVLRHLADGLKVGDMAEKMFVSPNTVKTHLRKVYRKLEVNSKQSALDRARVLRLL